MLDTAAENHEKELNVYPSDEPGELVKALTRIGPRGVAYVQSQDGANDGNILDAWGDPIQYQNNATTTPPKTLTTRIERCIRPCIDCSSSVCESRSPSISIWAQRISSISLFAAASANAASLMWWSSSVIGTEPTFSRTAS